VAERRDDVQAVASVFAGVVPIRDASRTGPVHDLGLIFRKHGCDKGDRHGYERVYEPILAPVREQPITLLEIGVYKGASLNAWLEYLPNATLIAVDTFERVPPQGVSILAHPRVRWFQCDSTVEAPDVGQVDFIIDDGCHDPEAQLATLRNFLPLLKPGGRYFVEDAPTLKVQGAWVHDFRRDWATDSRILEITNV
jgi:hypothetical protein